MAEVSHSTRQDKNKPEVEVIEVVEFLIMLSASQSMKVELAAAAVSQEFVANMLQTNFLVFSQFASFHRPSSSFAL